MYQSLKIIGKYKNSLKHIVTNSHHNTFLGYTWPPCLIHINSNNNNFPILGGSALSTYYSPYSLATHTPYVSHYQGYQGGSPNQMLHTIKWLFHDADDIVADA